MPRRSPGRDVVVRPDRRRSQEAAAQENMSALQDQGFVRRQLPHMENQQLPIQMEALQVSQWQDLPAERVLRPELCRDAMSGRP
jgi:hypothetical protein